LSLPVASIGREPASAADVLDRARQIDPFTLDGVQVRRLSREIQQARCAQTRIGFGGNVVFEPLREFVQAHLACHGIGVVTWEVPFNQVFQELVTPASALRSFDPHFLFLHFELASALPDPLARHAARNEAEFEARVEQVLAFVLPSVRMALSHTAATILLTNFVAPDCYALGIADVRAEFGEQELFATLNARLARTFRREPRVQIVDLSRLTAWHGRSRASDRRLFYVAKLPWHQSFLPVLADEVARHVGAALGRIRKCLVVDLDNTLWGGVLGEEGPAGVLVGPGDPVAEAYFDLQQRILALKKRGVLLAACSKNNPEDVEEVFQTRADMPLRREDFACMQVSWTRKDVGLRQIAAALNIGTDSLVFLDDSPAEIQLVRSTMPEVECVLLPTDPAQRATCLDRVHGFERVLVTAEDLEKTGQYQAGAARAAAQASFSNLDEYLRSLQMSVEIRRVAREMLPRVHQLFTKTNQFNLTTRRYMLGELERFAADPASCLLAARAEDCFGDLGWIGVILLRNLDQPQIAIDSFLLSCRAMGRGIETAILNHVKELCFSRQTCAAIDAQYVPTAKNMPVREMYEAHGFELADIGSDGSKSYRLERSRCASVRCDWLAVTGDAPG
jgi:FkbH-like protein